MSSTQTLAFVAARLRVLLATRACRATPVSLELPPKMEIVVGTANILVVLRAEGLPSTGRRASAATTVDAVATTRPPLVTAIST